MQYFWGLVNVHSLEGLSIFLWESLAPEGAVKTHVPFTGLSSMCGSVLCLTKCGQGLVLFPTKSRCLPEEVTRIC